MAILMLRVAIFVCDKLGVTLKQNSRGAITECFRQMTVVGRMRPLALSQGNGYIPGVMNSLLNQDNATHSLLKGHHLSSAS